MGEEMLLKSVAAKLRPSEKDIAEMHSQKEFVFGRLGATVPPDVEIGLVGSAAKGTSLGSNREIDVFMLMPRKYPQEKMAKLGLEWAKKAMKGEKTEIRYASHPYLKVHRGGFKIDIVPSYKIENSASIGSAVDRSQLHTSYVNGRMDEAQKDSVRLLKQFCKTLGVYGAELRVEGFSGYLCELLVLQYGSFMGVMEAAGKWGEKPKLDIANHHQKAALQGMFDSPLVVIDPVDPKRNVAAVVSKTSLSRFCYAARKFCHHPSREFFFHEKEVHSAKKLRRLIAQRGTHIIAIAFTPPEVVEDILWPQLRKSTSAIIRHLRDCEFRVFGNYFWSDQESALILIELMEGELPKVRERVGPAVWHARDVDGFVLRHGRALNLHFEHEKIIAVEKRGECVAENAVRGACKEWKKLGIPPSFAAPLKKAKFLQQGQLLSGKYLEIASDYFTRRV